MTVRMLIYILKHFYLIRLFLLQSSIAEMTITSSIIKYPNYVSKVRIEKFATYDIILNIASHSRCRAHCQSIELCVTTCWDESKFNCYLIQKAMILLPKTVEKLTDDLLCYTTENRYSFLEGQSTSAGGIPEISFKNKQNAPLESAFLNKLNKALRSPDGFRYCCVFNWYAVDLGSLFIPPATIRVYNLFSVNDCEFYLSSDPLPANQSTPTLNPSERLITPPIGGESPLQFYPFYIEASNPGKTFLIYQNHNYKNLSIGHLDVIFD